MRAWLPEVRMEQRVGTSHLRILTQRNVTIMAVRGTVDASDWAVNVAFAHGVDVGLAGAGSSVAADIAAARRVLLAAGGQAQVLVTGHSQGGYRALLVAKALGVKVVVFNALVLGAVATFAPGQALHMRMPLDVVSRLHLAVGQIRGLREVTVPSACDKLWASCLADSHSIANFYGTPGTWAVLRPDRRSPSLPSPQLPQQLLSLPSPKRCRHLCCYHHFFETQCVCAVLDVMTLSRTLLHSQGRTVAGCVGSWCQSMLGRWRTKDHQKGQQHTVVWWVHLRVCRTRT